MRNQLIGILSIWVVFLFPARADSPADPVPWVTTSKRGDHLFKMVPEKVRWEDGKSIVERKAFGVAYSITEDGDSHEIWRVKGWYADGGDLSDDGRHFVRFGPWARDLRKHSDLAIAFYDNGKLLKQYSVRELIRKVELLTYTASHYNWRAFSSTESTGFRDGAYHLVMIDKTAYKFDFTTGEILSTGEDAGPESLGGSWAESRAEENREGMKLFGNSPFREEYLPHFEIRDITLFRNTYAYGLFTRMIPKAPFKETVRVEAIFQEKEGERVEVSLTPSEILSAIEKALRHPFISRRFSDGKATGLRLRVRNDALYWNYQELAEFLEKLTGKKPGLAELKHWACFIIDSDEEPRFTSIYFNTKTGEIISEGASEWPWDPYLLDETGKRK